MKVITCFFLLLITAKTFADSSFEAINSFYKDIFHVEQSLPSVGISSDGCIRTGYNIKTNSVVFCPNDNTINSGLNSIDVIAHEFFHFYMCDRDREFCKSAISDINKKAILEAFADTFAYWFNPDPYFGEKFYKSKDYIRLYGSSYCYSLVQGGHDKGTALVAKLIELPVETVVNIVKEKKYSFEYLSSLFNDPCFSKKSGVEVIPLVGEKSKLNRYSITNSGRKLTINVKNIEDVTFSFKKSSLFNIRIDKNELTIFPKVKKGFEKIVIEIYNKGILVGNIPLYFKIK